MDPISSIDFHSPVPLAAVLALAGVLAIGFLAVRFAAGPRAEIARRWGLVVLRSLTLVLIVLLLANPVRVTESPGSIQRPDVFYLLDTSESMKMGGEHTRWNEALEAIGRGNTLARHESKADIKMFRFGERLASMGNLPDVSLAAFGPPADAHMAAASVTPGDADTRLLLALRQITSRFGRSPPAAIVLFSDGRARDEAGVREMAGHFAQLGVPIHVVPVGDTAGAGDVAIVAVVVPESVRRHSRVEVQVFLRSYGYDGRRAQVQLLGMDEEGQQRPLAPPQPITLRSGFQPLTLSFRADLNTRRVRIAVPQQPGEFSKTNNVVDSDIHVSRDKIRVLYVEGSRQLPRAVRRGEAIVLQGPYTDLHDALVADQDIECVVVSGAYGDLRRVGAQGRLETARGFPATSAELSAFDGLILSNVPRASLRDDQIEWIERWVGERGGGVCMVGGPASFAAGGWNDGSIEKMLPVTIDDGGDDWDPAADVKGAVATSRRSHPIWHIVSDAKQNRAILDKFPPFEGVHRGLRVKEALATPLATAVIGGGLNLGALFQPGQAAVGRSEEVPVLTAGRYGKGHTLAMSTAITAPWANAFLNNWGEGDNRYYAKFWRNVIYWLTEKSTIGRRRLIVDCDKRYYRPGETIALRAVAYDEGANLTQDYRIFAMIEPQSALFDPESLYSPVRWPNGVRRESGEEGPRIAWGEEFELPKLGAQTAGPLGASQQGYGLGLQIADALASGAAHEGLRIELTAKEDVTQVDSTSMQVRILHDPFEQQNPFPNHELLESLATASGGQVLTGPDDLAAMLTSLQTQRGPPTVRKSPVWSRWWVLAALLGLLAVEWFWRRHIGLA